MNCERCGNPYRFYGPPNEPPENHYFKCYQCNRTWYPYGLEEEYE